MNKDCNCQPHAPETAYLGEIPIDTLDSLPDFIIVERDVEDPATGDIVRTIVREPAQKLFPNGNFDNVSIIEGNNPSIKFTEGQVIAAYIKNEGNRNVVYKADATHEAQFIIVGTMPNGDFLIQPCGVINIVGGHRYIIGIDYYTGANGEPVTSNASGQRLFVPISTTKLLVTL